MEKVEREVEKAAELIGNMSLNFKSLMNKDGPAWK